ncbi:unnamed protein product [Parajaminaea phylloscopi]
MDQEARSLSLCDPMPGTIDARGKIRMRLLGNDLWCSLPLQMQMHRQGPATLRLAPATPTDRKTTLPLGAPPHVSRFLDGWDVLISGRPMGFAGMILDEDDGDDWDLDWCVSLRFVVEPLVPQARMDEVATRLVSRQGARMCTRGYGTVASMPPLTPAVQEWYGAAEVGATPGSHLLVKVDSTKDPRRLKYAVRGPQDASIPARWATLATDPPHARILVNLARRALGLPRRRSLRPHAGRPIRPALLQPVEDPETLIPSAPASSSAPTGGPLDSSYRPSSPQPDARDPPPPPHPHPSSFLCHSTTVSTRSPVARVLLS